MSVPFRREQRVVRFGVVVPVGATVACSVPPTRRSPVDGVCALPGTKVPTMPVSYPGACAMALGASARASRNAMAATATTRAQEGTESRRRVRDIDHPFHC